MERWKRVSSVDMSDSKCWLPGLESSCDNDMNKIDPARMSEYEQQHNEIAALFI